MTQDTHQTGTCASIPNPLAPVTGETAQDAGSSAFERHLLEVEGLVNDTKRFLVRNEAVLEQEGLKGSMETLERWVESYRRGLAAARKLSESGRDILSDVRDRLKLASDEMTRLEGEGGNNTTRQQATEVENLIKASRRLERLIPSIETMFCDVKAIEEALPTTAKAS